MSRRSDVNTQPRSVKEASRSQARPEITPALEQMSLTRSTIEGVSTRADDHLPARRNAVRRSRLSAVVGVGGIGVRRFVVGLALTFVGLPALTAVLVGVRPHLALVDDLLLYLAAVIAVTLVGGFWPAVIAAAASILLLNWFFTPPLHTWTIDAPQNLLALLLFVTVAVTVSSVVHLAARRAAQSSVLAAESAELLALARTVLAGDDTARAVLDHLRAALHCEAELVELVAGRWVRVAGSAGMTDAVVLVRPRDDLELRVYGAAVAADPLVRSGRVLDAFGVQAAAALDRERLRAQAAHAEALAEGNRMRTALLTAVSHDLRTPLASVKASVSTLRQTDVEWTPEDQAELLATIEEGADRLDALISNLLDMSRIQTGSLQPFLQPTALEEVAPLVVRSVEGANCLDIEISDDLPLVATDPGLLERALANLVSNAIRYSPPEAPPTLTAQVSDSRVIVAVIDHGPGVALAQRGQMMQPFQQVGEQRSGGVGLGLAVANGLVEAIGGRLSAETTPGGGLTMRVELPLAAAAASEITASTSQ